MYSHNTCHYIHVIKDTKLLPSLPALYYDKDQGTTHTYPFASMEDQLLMNPPVNPMWVPQSTVCMNRCSNSKHIASRAALRCTAAAAGCPSLPMWRPDALLAGTAEGVLWQTRGCIQRPNTQALPDRGSLCEVAD